MLFFWENLFENLIIIIFSWKIFFEFVFFLVIGLVLLGLLSNKVINELLLEIGLYSEEIFCGDCLLIFKFF